MALAENDGSYELLRSEPVVLSPANRIRVEDINANAGDSSVTYEVLIDCVEDLQGWTLALEFNSTIMGLNNITIEGTDAAGLVEFELPNIDNSNGTVIYANILDLAPPFDNQVLSPGVDMSLPLVKLSSALVLLPEVTPSVLRMVLWHPPLHPRTILSSCLEVRWTLN